MYTGKLYAQYCLSNTLLHASFMTIYHMAMWVSQYRDGNLGVSIFSLTLDIWILCYDNVYIVLVYFCFSHY